MKILLASPRGFCAGVVRAIEVVERALAIYGPPIFTKHSIVHNRYVIELLHQKGAVTVEHPDEAPEGSTIVFSAHGSPPEDYAAARKRHQKIIDATCPLVTKVHNEAIRYFREGYRLVYIGHKGHVESRGSLGYAPMEFVDDREAVGVDTTPGEKLAILSQTTLSVDDLRHLTDTVKEKNPQAIIRSDLCYAVSNRQLGVKDLAEYTKVIFVIGSPESSNANRMVEIARDAGALAFLVEDPQHIPWEEIPKEGYLGVTSGASTPEDLLLQVIEALKPESVETHIAIKEQVVFTLPKEVASGEK